MRGGWEGLAKIENLFPKVLRFRPLQNKRIKEKDKKRDDKNPCKHRTKLHQPEPKSNRNKPNPDNPKQTKSNQSQYDGQNY